MKFGIYPRLALTGIRKNRQLYYPYLLACAGMVFLYFILASLAASPIVAAISGARTTKILLNLGKNIIIIFAAVFLFYTNSFLMRRRQREFGLYNVLGMSKGNIVRIQIWETLFTAVIALACGIVFGVALYKLVELALVRLMQGEITYTISIVWNVIPKTALIFGGIFLLLFVFNLLKIRLSNPIALLHSENVGEKPPKANWLPGLAGVVLLGAGYGLAVSIQKPLAAFYSFFIAVALVAAGTYLIFIAGSVSLCRLLQKNRRYYYKPEHFVSVSSMTYRMKRNGAGLASICLLATSVLVIMSAGVSLFSGMNDILQARYPTDFIIKMGSCSPMTEEQEQTLMAFASNGLSVENERVYEYIYAQGILDGDSLQFSGIDDENGDGYWEVTILDLDTYNALSGASAKLSEDEILIASSEDMEAPASFYMEMAGTFQVKEQVEYLSVDSESSESLYHSLLIVVRNLDTFTSLLDAAKTDGTNYLAVYSMFQYSFDAKNSREEQIAVYQENYPQFTEIASEIVGEGAWIGNYDSFASHSNDYYSLYGGIFFLAAFFSAMFLMTTVLIIYYKQISEGYEDAGRFEIMQKVGMTKGEIRRSINSQMLTVFLLPVGMAGLHMVFAFFIIKKILLTFGFENTALFAGATCVCYAVFAVIYGVVYRITSNAYYRLVSDREAQGAGSAA